MNTQPLRNMKRNTELLILTELLEKPSVRMRDIAQTLGITVQAVSQYIASMRQENLLRNGNDALRPTRKGMAALQEHFGALKTKVDSILRSISVIDNCVAIAEKPMTKGSRAGLVMRRGVLVACPGKPASSTGVALEDAGAGEDVLLGALEGIVDLKLGRLTLLEAPSENDGGSKKANIPKARKLVAAARDGEIVAGDLVAIALAGKSGARAPAIHAPVEHAMSALCKGVDVLFCGTKPAIGRMLEAVRTLRKDTGYEISWELHGV